MIQRHWLLKIDGFMDLTCCTAGQPHFTGRNTRDKSKTYWYSGWCKWWGCWFCRCCIWGWRGNRGEMFLYRYCPQSRFESTVCFCTDGEQQMDGKETSCSCITLYAPWTLAALLFTVPYNAFEIAGSGQLPKMFACTFRQPSCWAQVSIDVWLYVWWVHDISTSFYVPNILVFLSCLSFL